MGDNDSLSSTNSSDSTSEHGEGSEHGSQKRNIKKELNRIIADHFARRGNDEKKGMSYTADEIIMVLERVKAIFQKQPMLVYMKAPVNVCGDIHGQFHDLKRIFRAYGRPPTKSYLFLGDYVDRGRHSLEVLMLLFSLKARCPNTLILLRGNHECMNINRVYGFYDELQRRGLGQLYPEFNEVFSWMPISAIINNRIMCMHGGISQNMTDMNDILNMKRPLIMKNPGAPPIAMDILWADPDKKKKGYSKSKRGVSQQFGMDVLEEFCVKFKLELIVRAHQVVPRGFERMGSKDRTRIVTIFSAPNYCGEMDNCAAVMIVSDNLGVKFCVLEPDANIAAERNEIRADVPMFDVFPQMDIDFNPITSGVAKVFDTASTATASAASSAAGKAKVLASDTSDALSNIPLSEFTRNAKERMGNLSHRFKRSMREGSKREGSVREGSKREGSKREGSKREGSKREGSKRETSKREGSKREK